MKKIFVSLIFLFVFITAVVSQGVPIGTGEWSPYTGANLLGLGYANHLVAEAFKQEGVTANFDFKPWPRVETDTASGVYLATPGWTNNEEREAKFIFSNEPLTVDRSVFIVLADSSFNWNTKDELKNYTISCVRSDYYLDDLTTLGVNVFGTTEYIQGLKLVLGKRVDAFIVNETVGNQLIRTFSAADQAKIKIYPMAYDETNYYLMFSRKYPNVELFVDKFNSGFAKIKESGLYQEMLNNLSMGKYD